MNETERQIVAWLRDQADALEEKERPDMVSRSFVAGIRFAASGVERRKHRDKQDG